MAQFYRTLLCASLLSASGCSSPSLVGAKDLPSDATLASETIEARLKTKSDNGAHQVLRMRISPDDSVLISWERIVTVSYGKPHIVTVEAKRTTKLAPEAAANIRRKLGAMRPPALGSHWPFAFVEDCPGMSSHPDNVLVVAFSKGEREGGLFMLERRCGSGRAAEALQLIDDVRSQLPNPISFPTVRVGA